MHPPAHDGEHLYRRAEEVLPRHVYEGKGVYVAYIALLITLFHLIPIESTGQSLPLSIITAVSLTLAMALDQATTEQTVAHAKKIEEELEVLLPLFETAIHLPDRPKKEDLYAKKVIALHALLLTVGTSVPQLGLPFALIRGLAAANNYRIDQRLTKVMELSQTDTDGKYSCPIS